MLEKALLDKALRLIKVGSIKVSYWTGETVVYGSGELYGHLTINSAKAIRAFAKGPTLGFGEGYMSGEIEFEGDLAMIGRFATENAHAMGSISKLRPLFAHKNNPNRQSKQAQQIQHHYDLGNDFYRLWLDDSLTYSCAYFQTPQDTLEQAQIQKLEHTLRKLQLRPGMRLLDIGSGWGQLLIKAVQDYGVTGHGITLSQEQYRLSTARAKELGLEDKLTFELINYQDLAKRQLTFDRIASVGMFEHVGRHNQRDYFKAVNQLLAPGGLTLLHTITNQTPGPTDPWTDRYIFPGGYIPAVAEITELYPDYGWSLLDYENLRLHYAMTLNEWRQRFEAHKDEVIKRYDERFYRMWRLYLAGSESGFRWGDLSLSQFVFSKAINNELPLTRDFLYRPKQG